MRRRDMLAGSAALGASALWVSGNDASAQHYAQDVDILEAAYTQLHPGLYRYATPIEVSARFRVLRRDFRADRTMRQNYLTLSRFLASVRCGHTYANFYNQSRAVQSELFDGGARIPFQFRLVGDAMIVTNNQSGDPRLARGTEVRAIDGRSVGDIVQCMTTIARADGHNDAKRRALLEVSGFDRYETFDVFYPMMFPRRGDAFTLETRAPGARRNARVMVPGIGLDQRRAGMVGGLEGSDPTAVVWRSELRDDVAILTMPTWALYNSTWDWRGWLDQTLSSYAGARGLIVDLRGNEGGNDCGNEIIARFLDQPLPLTTDERRVRFRSTPASLNPYLDTWDDSFRTLGEDAEDLGDGLYRLPAEEGVSSIEPKGPRLRMPLIVLIDAQNSSATFQFAQIVQANRLGRLFGSPTGGNQRGINGGAFFFVRLPASGLEADLPLIGRFPPAQRPDAGLTPDVQVALTAEAIAAGRDIVLDSALSSI